MTITEARYVWENSAHYPQQTVDYALQILTEAGEL